MKRLTRISFAAFESLRGTDSNLFHALLKATKAEPGGKVVVVDSADIKGEAFQIRWKQYVERNPSVVLSTTTEQDELWQVEQEQAQRDAQKAEVEAQSKAAVDRYLTHWIGERKLVNCDTNTQAVLYQAERIQAKEPQQIMSPALLDRAVNAANLAGTLIWKAAEEPAPPPAPPVEPPPPKVLLADGSEQLPLGTIPRTSHSLAQLRDLDRREREARNVAVRTANNEVAQAFRDAAAVSEITL